MSYAQARHGKAWLGKARHGVIRLLLTKGQNDGIEKQDRDG